MHEDRMMDMNPKQVAHDLRNALCPILIYAESLEASLAASELTHEQETAQMICAAIKEMDALIIEKLGTDDSA